RGITRNCGARGCVGNGMALVILTSPTGGGTATARTLGLITTARFVALISALRCTKVACTNGLVQIAYRKTDHLFPDPVCCETDGAGLQTCHSKQEASICTKQRACPK